jgi:replicative DNA helicase Mcm
VKAVVTCGGLILERREFINNLETILKDKYRDKIEKAITDKREKFTVNFGDFSEDDKTYISTEYRTLSGTDGILSASVTQVFNTIAREKGICGPIESPFRKIYLHISHVVPRYRIRELTSEMFNQLVEVNGVVISSGSPQSIISVAIYKCKKCDGEIQVLQDTSVLLEPDGCTCGGKTGFILIEHKCKWDDYQEITLQEKPDEVREGVIPRTMKMICKGKHLIDRCKPGDVVNVSCALIPVQVKKANMRVYSQCLDVNYIEVTNKDSYSIELVEDDKEYLDSLSTHPDLQNVLVRSVFPSIYEHNDEKLGMILAMFGGIDRKKSDISQRGTINVLLIGDPSVAKTRMLQAISNAAPKVIYTSGTGTSGVGLTAAAVQDQNGWRLEAGALVLADGGICCIDEIEKISDDDRGKIHEAMSKQTVSIDKASIHTTLNARTTVIAAANPTHGRYDNTEYLTENVSLPPTILSRFDLIFIIRDIPDVVKDREMAEVIFDVKAKVEGEEMIDTDTLRKYVLYSKQITPIMTKLAIDRIMDFYIPLRQQSVTIENTPIAVAARQLEGLRRLSEARARMFLRKEVTVEDAEVAIELMARSLIMAGYDPKTGKTDVSIVESGKPLSKDNIRKRVMKILETAEEMMSTDDILEAAQEMGLDIDRSGIMEILRPAEREGYLYVPEKNLWAHGSKANLYKHKKPIYVDKENE